MAFIKGVERNQIEQHRCGAPGYHPSLLLKLYIYGYMNSVRLSRKLEKETGN